MANIITAFIEKQRTAAEQERKRNILRAYNYAVSARVREDRAEGIAATPARATTVLENTARATADVFGITLAEVKEIIK
jgi:hypothetical protein